MGRACTTCSHEARHDIDRELVGGAIPIREIARRRGLTKDSLGRHKRSHLPVSLVRLHREQESDRARPLAERVEALVTKLERLAEAAEQDGQANLILQTARELRETYRLHGHLTGELDDRPQVNVLNLHADPEWLRIRAAIWQALEPYPEALEAVQGVLREQQELTP